MIDLFDVNEAVCSPHRNMNFCFASMQAKKLFGLLLCIAFLLFFFFFCVCVGGGLSVLSRPPNTHTHTHTHTHTTTNNNECIVSAAFVRAEDGCSQSSSLGSHADYDIAGMTLMHLPLFRK